MKMGFFLSLSALFHTVSITGLAGWGGLSHNFSSYVQKGEGSIEVEIVIPQRAFQSSRGSSDIGKLEHALPRHSGRSRIPPEDRRTRKSGRNLDDVELLSNPLTRIPKLERGIQRKILALLAFRKPRQANCLHACVFFKPIGLKLLRLGSTRQFRDPGLVVYRPEKVGALGINSSAGLTNPPPRYPRMAILKGWEGETWVRISINKDGGVSKMRVIRSSGYAVLDDAVLEVIKDWQFEKGKSHKIDIPFRFLLRSQK